MYTICTMLYVGSATAYDAFIYIDQRTPHLPWSALYPQTH